MEDTIAKLLQQGEGGPLPTKITRPEDFWLALAQVSIPGNVGRYSCVLASFTALLQFTATREAELLQKDREIARLKELLAEKETRRRVHGVESSEDEE